MAASSKKNERRFPINGVGEREDFSARLEAIEGVTSCEVTYQGYTRTECLVQIRVPSGDTKSFTLKVGAPFHGRCSATLACLEGADEGECSYAVWFGAGLALHCAGLYGVSATRGVTVEDIDSAHPILAAITSGSSVPFNKDNFTVQGIYFGGSKKQPALFCKTVLDYSLVGEIPAPDGKNTSYLLVNKSNRETLDELKVSEAARAHLNMTI